MVAEVEGEVVVEVVLTMGAAVVGVLVGVAVMDAGVAVMEAAVLQTSHGTDHAGFHPHRKTAAAAE